MEARRFRHGDPGPQRRVVERDLTPVSTHMRGFEPKLHRHAEPAQVLEDEEPKDPCEELGR